VYVSLDGGLTFTAIDQPPFAMASNVQGFEWDAMDPTTLYISTAGRSVAIVKFNQ
jgi:hypothetical protein